MISSLPDSYFTRCDNMQISDLPVRHQQPQFIVMVLGALPRTLEFTDHDGTILRMGALDHQAHSGLDASIETQDLIGLVRPEVSAGSHLPGKTARCAEFLRFERIRLAPPQGALSLLAVLDVDIGSIPGNDGASLVPQSLGAKQEPAIRPVETP